MTQLAIADGHAVTVHYRLTLDDGSTVEDSYGGDPLFYVQGTQSLVAGLESGLAGLTEGEYAEIVVEPEFGYGPYDPKAERTVPRSMFPGDFDVRPGAAFQASGPRGVLDLWVKSTDGDDVVVTSNHPLSGKRLNYQVHVLEVRKATADEVAPPDT